MAEGPRFPRSSVGPAGLIGDAIKQIVTVLYAPAEKDGKLIPAGTGFLISYPSRTRGDGGYRLVVTARHVVTNAAGTLQPGLRIRINRKGGGTELLEIAADEQTSRVFFHPDPKVDLCILPAGLDQKVYEFRTLRHDFFAPSDALKVPMLKEGAEVIFLGLFVHHPGEQRNQPIVRFGKVALVPTESILWGEHLLDLILIEAQAFQGNSGAPVFVFLGDRDENGLPIPRLLGVLKGALTQKVTGRFEDDENVRFWLPNTVGVSAVIPAYLLEEMLRETVIPALDKTALKADGLCPGPDEGR